MQYHVKNWRKLTGDPWVLETITGYHMKFDSILKQTRVPKPSPFGGFKKHLIDDETVTLKIKGAIEEVPSCPNEFLLNNIFSTQENW